MFTVSFNLRKTLKFFKSLGRSSRTRCDIYLKLTIKTPERYSWCHSSVLLLTLGSSHTLYCLLIKL